MKNSILEVLIDNRGSYISGELLSAELGITRAAVWKNIKALKDDGFDIDSVQNKGYSLKKIPDIYNEVLIYKGLATKSLARSVEIHKSLDSTNDRAKQLASEGAPHGMLVISEEQVKGRGRRGRSWSSPAGTGIWMSLVLRPLMPPQQAQQLTIIAALSAAEAIEEVSGLKAGIKWPNDIIVNDKKVCGILTEMQAEADEIDFIIVGIGINANGGIEVLPPDIRETAETLENASGRKVNRVLLATSLINRFESLYDKYVNEYNLSFVLEKYKAYSVTLSKQVKVSGPVESFEGTAVDIADDGALLVELKNGTIRKVFSGDVSVRGIAGYV